MSAEVAMTTNGGPQGHVQPARNLRSESERPWRTHAVRNRQLASPIETHAIYATVQSNPTTTNKEDTSRGSERGRRQTWFDTPTIFCNHPHNSPLPIKLLPKQRILTLLVASSAGSGIPLFVVQLKTRGACAVGWVTERPYRTRVPAKSAWFPAERTEVRMTVFMKEAAASVMG